MRVPPGVCAALLLGVTATEAGEPARWKQSMEVGLQGRAFFDDAAFPDQEDSGASVSAEPEFDFKWSRDASMRFVPFGRWDEHDDERTHADVRELTLRLRHGSLDIVAGVGHVFWGVTESVHLVDVLNQTDLVENPDGEEKLGQPMLSLGWTTPYGRFEGFLLPYFRERRLPGIKGRLRAPLPYDRGDALYESGAEEEHIDGAVRWSLSRGKMDLGLTHFSGTARDPGFVVTPQGDGTVLTPVYDLIEQTGLDFNLVTGGWIWKLEAIHQDNRVEDFSAAAAGYEYTFSSVFGTGWDVGALTEYLWDERQEDAPTPFQNDLFVGTRLAGNDVAGTELLAGAVIDLDHDASFVSIEGSRRLGPSGKIVLELRTFGTSEAQDPLAAFRRDDYLQLEYIHYF